MEMTSKRRLLTALEGRVPDRLPVTPHRVMTDFLDTYIDGKTKIEFFDHFGLDVVHRNPTGEE
jgi:hypothetical protein